MRRGNTQLCPARRTQIRILILVQFPNEWRFELKRSKNDDRLKRTTDRIVEREWRLEATVE